MALAYHKPEALQENPGIVTKQAEGDYYKNLLHQMDIDIQVKNGVIPLPETRIRNAGRTAGRTHG